MKLSYILMTTSSLMLTARSQYTPLSYCNADSDFAGFAYSGTNWVLLGNVQPFFESNLLTYIGPGMCQVLSYGKEYSRFFRYHVCNNTVYGSYNDPRCHPTINPAVGWGSYIGELNISVHITYFGNILSANFTPYAEYAKNMTMDACQINPSYYNIYINTTQNMPSCFFSDDDVWSNDDPSDDTTDNSSSSKGYTLTTQDKVVIGILAAIIGGPCAIILCCTLFNIISNFYTETVSIMELRRRNAELEKMISPLLKDFVISFQNLKIDKSIGHGSFGEVYTGSWKGSRLEVVAIKKFKIKKSIAEVKKNFEYEATLLSTIKHPNIIEFLGVCTHEASYCFCLHKINYYLIMKCMSMSLYDFLYGINRSLVRLSKLSIARDVENGLEYLHHKNIIHADIKSLNILIDGATGKAVLSDFGLAYMKNKLPFQMTYGGNKYSSLIIGEKKVAGTLRWMAPELFETGEYSNESDIYAYGIVLYELIYKKIPFSRVANKDVPKLVCNNRRPETSTLTHPVEIALASLMHKCWDQRAEYRPKHLEIQRELSVIRDVQDQEDTVSPNYTASMANQSSIYAHFSVNPLTALGRFAQPRQKTGLQQTLTL